MHYQIRVSGFGGQGIILAGYIIGKGASIYDKANVSFTQSYGPEARGGACSSQVIISSDEIDYPHVTDPDAVIIMSQAAYAKFGKSLKAGTFMLTDSDLVKTEEEDLKGMKHYAINATKIAEEIGKKIVANIVMLGFFTGITKMVSKEGMLKAVESTVPAKMFDINKLAFENGYNEAEKALAT
jgi:2-oxoglutarate ferredoxin oxidoreductase subunit gamma